MLRKWFLVVTVTAIALSLSASPSFSARNNWKKKTFTRHVRHDYQAYRHRQNAVLHMYPVDENGQWQLTRNAPRGLMQYWMWGKTFNFTFRGIKLAPHTDYTLIYAVDSDTASDIVLGEGTTDRRGRIYFENIGDTCSMPAEYDANYPYGARILLVPSDALYQGNVPLAADPGAFLEGSHLIKFFDIDGCDAPVVDDGEVDEFPDVVEEPQTDEIPEMPESEIGTEQPVEDPPSVPVEEILF